MYQAHGQTVHAHSGGPSALVYKIRGGWRADGQHCCCRAGLVAPWLPVPTLVALSTDRLGDTAAGALQQLRRQSGIPGCGHGDFQASAAEELLSWPPLFRHTGLMCKLSACSIMSAVPGRKQYGVKRGCSW